jgi:hypothetical protein
MLFVVISIGMPYQRASSPVVQPNAVRGSTAEVSRAPVLTGDLLDQVSHHGRYSLCRCAKHRADWDASPRGHRATLQVFDQDWTPLALHAVPDKSDLDAAVPPLRIKWNTTLNRPHPKDSNVRHFDASELMGSASMLMDDQKGAAGAELLRACV